MLLVSDIYSILQLNYYIFNVKDLCYKIKVGGISLIYRLCLLSPLLNIYSKYYL